MKVEEMRKVISLMDELKPFLKRGTKEDDLCKICAKYICNSDKAETKVKPAENVIQ